VSRGERNLPEELDLTHYAEERASETSAAFTPPTVRDPIEGRREWVRSALAGALILLLFFVVVITFVGALASADPMSNLRSVLEIVLAPIIGLVGAVTGFYFGEKKP
jgi:hypothetical protein